MQFSRIENCTLHLKLVLEVTADELDNNYLEKIQSILTSTVLSAGNNVKLQEDLIPAILKGVNGINYIDMTGYLETSESGKTPTYKHGTIGVGLRQQPVITNDSIEVTISE